MLKLLKKYFKLIQIQSTFKADEGVFGPSL